MTEAFKTIAITVLVLLTPFNALALTQEDSLHLVAHVGGSFVLQTGFYGINSRWLGMDPAPAEFLAFMETFSVGLAYKAAQHWPSDTNQSLGYDAIGSATAAICHVTFNF